MRIGSLFSGAGGLDMAVEAVFGATTAWHCEVDSAASKVLSNRWPCVPNLGDITTIGKHPKVDWDYVEPVDILCGGYPCQPFSAAGQRKGTSDERHLWPYFAEAIRRIRPRFVVLENVAGHRSMGFDRVLADLAGIGYDSQWCSVRASDVGAPHRRARLFVVAYPNDGAEHGQWTRAQSRQGSADVAVTASDGRHEGRSEPAWLVGGSNAAVGGNEPVELLPTPRSTCGGSNTETVALLPTLLRSSDCFGPGLHGDGGMDLRTAVTLLPTPTMADFGRGSVHPDRRRELNPKHSPELHELARHVSDWGKYELAIRRWETLTRPAPSPTEPNTKGNPRLSAAFSEWMMGWPQGWVTNIPGISRNDQLRIIGNGVVPQQASAALHRLINVSATA